MREIRTHRPDIVVTIDPERKWIRHQDHFVTGRVALDAVFPYARDYLAYPDLIAEGLEPHKTLEVYLWGTDDPDTFIDIDEHFEEKLNALYCHSSQMSSSKEEGRMRLRNRFSVYGPKVNAEIAEAFKQVNPDDPKAAEAQYASRNPTRALGDPKDVGNLVTFLLSKENGYVSGQTIAIDGGESNMYGNAE